MIFVTLFFASLIFFMFLAIVLGAPFVFSKKEVAQKMIELLDLKKGEIFYDLGSGDGRLLILAAQKGAKAVGIEINPYAVLWSWLRILLAGQSHRARVKWGSYWRANVGKADKVAVYALPQVMASLGEKLKREVRPGLLVVSNSFQIPNFKLLKTDTSGPNTIYLYRI